MKVTWLYLIPLAVFMACNNKSPKQEKLTYPVTKKDSSVSDNYFGTVVYDPYRWLEDDHSEETKAWVKAQNAVTFAYLDKIPFRGKIRERLTKIWNYPKYQAPYRDGGYYFMFKNDGLQNQSVLYFMKNLEDQPEVLLDPNTFSKEGTASLNAFSVDKTGKYAAYSVSEGGSDWTTIKVMTLPDKKLLEDEIKWVKFSGISWWKNGFFYSRFPETKAQDELKSANEFQKVYYHELGTPQYTDVLVEQDELNGQLGFYASVTDDERFLVISVASGTYGNMIRVKDLNKGLNSPWVHIVKDFNNESSVVDSENGSLYLHTNIGAPNNRLVKVDPAKPDRDNWQTIIPGHEKNVLREASLVADKWFVTYIEDAAAKVKVYDKKGVFLYEVSLPGIGNISGFGAKKTESEIFYSFTSFTYPSAVFRYDIAQNKSEVYKSSEVDFKPDDFEVKQVFYPSKDGTKIPMFIVFKKGIKLDGTNPTLLYGYGGFDISLLPSFSISNIVFLEQGGVYAMANLRGGGEYGEAWHKAGMLLKKQNVFDDFIAAAEYLVKEKYTSPEKLAIHGRSNGGLLVGAVMTQRPELFKVALPGVGVLDMMRYHKFTIGHAWGVEYGRSDEEKYAAYLLGYSPLHTLKKGVKYPATMVMTADHDDRVVPAHSFKFAATLQEMHGGETPVVIRIDEQAGHGAGKSTKMLIEESTDFWSFILYNLGEDFK